MPSIETNMTDWFPSALREDADEKGNVLIVGKFADHRQLDVSKSREMDEKVYRVITKCWIKAIGQEDVSCVTMKPANHAELIQRFPDAWDAYSDGSLEVEGTPLTELEGIDETKALHLRLAGYRVLEEFATAPDAVCTNLGFGTRKLRDRAIEFLAGPEAGEAIKKAKTPPPTEFVKTVVEPKSDDEDETNWGPPVPSPEVQATVNKTLGRPKKVKA
jgi:hypothetical protein